MSSPEKEKLFHDLLNSLTVITGQCEVLKFNADARTRDGLNTIQRFAMKMADDILYVREKKLTA